MPTVVNFGTKSGGGPNIQAPWGAMTSGGRGLGGGGGMGYGGGLGGAYGMRRRPGAGRIDPNMRDPNYQPPELPFSPYEDKPYGRGTQPQTPTNDNINIYQDYPGFHPLNMLKDQVPSGFRSASGVGQSSTAFPMLRRLSDATMAYRGQGPSQRGGMFGGGQGFGEGYPGDALRRLLMARVGGGF